MTQYPGGQSKAEVERRLAAQDQRIRKLEAAVATLQKQLAQVQAQQQAVA